MPIEVLMPALSPTMTEGTLAKWMKKEGEAVAAGDVLAEIETDKATMEVEAVDEGVLGRILVPDGSEGVPVNRPIALLLEEGEDSGALDSYEAAGKASSKAEAAPEAPRSQPSVAAEAPAAAQPPVAIASGISGAGDRVFASPLARRMAKQAGIDISAIRGSGPNGRIVKADVATAAGRAAPRVVSAAAPAAHAAIPSGPGARALADAYGMAYSLQPNSNIRKTIARRLTEAKQTVPHFYLTVDCEIDLLLQARKAINAQSDGPRVSVNDFVIRAAALALKKVPAANASWDDEGILLYEHADISVAVATPNGLITPIVKAAEQKSLPAISTEMKDLAARARDGKLKPEEFQGGTFSVSNLGMFGIKDFAAIINPPQGCILAVGAGEPRPVVKNGVLAVATVMSCTLSVDHRVVDGAVGAEFIAAFKGLIENPFALLLSPERI